MTIIVAAITFPVRALLLALVCVSILLAADTYTEDRVGVRSGGADSATGSRYRLGPTYAASAEYRGRALGAADLRLSVRGRYRSEFSGDDGRRFSETVQRHKWQAS